MAHLQIPEEVVEYTEIDLGLSAIAITEAEKGLQGALDAFHHVSGSGTTSIQSPVLAAGVVTTKGNLNLPKAHKMTYVAFRLKDPALFRYWPVLSLLALPRGYYYHCTYESNEYSWYEPEASLPTTVYTLKMHLITMHAITEQELLYPALMSATAVITRKQLLEQNIVHTTVGTKRKTQITPFSLQEINWLAFARESSHDIYRFPQRIVATHGLDLPMIANYYGAELVDARTIRMPTVRVMQPAAERHFRIFVEGRVSDVMFIWDTCTGLAEPLSFISSSIIMMSITKRITTMGARDMLFRMYFESFRHRGADFARFCAIMQTAFGYATNADLARIPTGRAMGGTISPGLGPARMRINAALAGNIGRNSDPFFAMASGVPDLD